MTLLTDLEAFFQEHRRCGDLASEVTDGEPWQVIVSCSCGGFLVRQVDPVVSAPDAGPLG